MVEDSEAVGKTVNSALHLNHNLHVHIFQPEGIEKEFTDTYLIALTKPNTTLYLRNVSIYFPMNTVEGSEKVTVSVTGQLFYSSLSTFKNQNKT